jgi:hypothetical protein
MVFSKQGGPVTKGRLLRRLVIGVVVIASGAAACTHVESPEGPDGVVCTSQFVFGLAVTVLDKASGQRICDAEVVAIAGPFRETMSAFGPSEACTYAGAGERAGTYEVRASRAGFSPTTMTDIRVGADECHVIPARVVIEMER